MRSSIVYLLVIILVWSSGKLCGQHRSTQFLLSLEKRYKLTNEWDVRFQQIFQASPEFSEFLDAGLRDVTFDAIDFLGTIGAEDCRPGHEHHEDTHEIDDREDEEDRDEEDEEEEHEASEDDLDDVGLGESGSVHEDCPPLPQPILISQQDNGSFDEFVDELNLRAASSVRLRYRFSSHLQASIRYSYITRPGQDAHQWVTELAHLVKMGDSSPFRWSSRLRFQQSARQNETEKWRFNNYLRLRGRLFLTGELSPYGEGELFYRFRKGDNEFRYFRLGTGLRLKLNKKTRFYLGYRYQERLNSSNKRYSHTLSMETNYRF